MLTSIFLPPLFSIDETPAMKRLNYTGNIYGNFSTEPTSYSLGAQLSWKKFFAPHSLIDFGPTPAPRRCPTWLPMREIDRAILHSGSELGDEGEREQGKKDEAPRETKKCRGDKRKLTRRHQMRATMSLSYERAVESLSYRVSCQVHVRPRRCIRFHRL